MYLINFTIMSREKKRVKRISTEKDVIDRGGKISSFSEIFNFVIDLLKRERNTL